MSVALFVLSLAVILQSLQECSSGKDIRFEAPEEGTMENKEVISQFRDFPYSVSLYRRGIGHACGGTILNSEWIITAARCTENLGDIKVASNLHQFGNTHRAIDVRFPGKLVPFVGNDIALLKIHPPIKYTNFAKPAYLPKQNHVTPIGTRATFAGWGSNTVNGSRPLHLLKMDVMVLDMGECRRAFNGSYPLNDFTNICAAATDYQKTPYRGDSGGSLIANDELIGIVPSVTLGCGKTFCPTVYTGVTRYVQWIVETIGNR